VKRKFICESCGHKAAMVEAAPCPKCGSEMRDAGPHTSEAVDERPFVVDGVDLTEQQALRIANLVAGRARPGGSAMDVPAAVDAWRRQNHVVTLEGGRQAWRVHSASPTWREDIGEAGPAPLRLDESALLEALDAEGRVWEVVLIREGWSRNGRYYPGEVLEAATPLFNCDIYAYGWTPEARGMGHLPGHVRDSVSDVSRNKIGWTTEAAYRLDENSRGMVCATFHCADLDIGRRVAEAWRQGNRSFLGFSIDGTGEWAEGVAEGRRGRIVTAINHLSETTLVSDPAAGGRFERLVAAGTPNPVKEEPMNLKKRIQEFLRSKRVQESAIDGMSDQQLAEAAAAQLKEGDALLLKIVKTFLEKADVENAMMVLDELINAEGGESPAAEPAAEDPMMAAYAESAKKAVAEARQIAEAVSKTADETRKRGEAIALREAAIILRERMAESNLPLPVANKVRKRFEGRAFAEADLLEAIDEERKVLAELSGTGEVRLTGQSADVSILREAQDKHQAVCDLIMGYKPKSGEERMYEGFVNRPMSIARLYEAMPKGRDFQEATTSDIANLLNTSAEKALVQMYAEMPKEWEQFVEINPNVTNFKTQDRIRWNEFTTLSQQSESTSTDYSDLGFPTDDKSTYAIDTFGGMVTITRRMIINDDLGALRRLPQLLAKAANRRVHLNVFNLLTGATGGTVNGDTIYDSLAIYHANHFNKTTSALTHAAFVAARLQIQNQQAYGQKTAINGSSMANTTDPVQITVDSTTGFVAGQYVVIEAEICKIDSVDSGTTMTVSRGKRGTSAVSHANDTVIYQLAGEIPLSKIHVVYPYELEATMALVLGSEKMPGSAVNDINFLQREATAGRIVQHPVPASYLGGDTNNWFLVADKADIPVAELAFLNNQQNPEILVQDNPLVGNVFTRDNIRFKVRHEYSGAVLDFRGLQGNIVA